MPPSPCLPAFPPRHRDEAQLTRPGRPGPTRWGGLDRLRNPVSLRLEGLQHWLLLSAHKSRIVAVAMAIRSDDNGDGKGTDSNKKQQQTTRSAIVVESLIHMLCHGFPKTPTTHLSLELHPSTCARRYEKEAVSSVRSQETGGEREAALTCRPSRLRCRKPEQNGLEQDSAAR